MKVVCIDNEKVNYGDEELYYKRQDNPSPELVEGIVYDVREYEFNHSIGYIIDIGDKSWYYNTYRFEDLDKIRNKKLESIGI